MAQPQQQRPNPPPIDQLQGMLNLMYTMLGGALKPNPKLRDPAQRMQLQQAVQQGSFRFQDALDKMEKELMEAQHYLKRDFALHKAMERQKVEQASAAKEVKQQPAPTPVQNVTTKKEEEDVVMLDAPKPVAQASVAPVAPMMVAPPAASEPAPTADAATTTAAAEPTDTTTADAPATDLDFSVFGDDLTNPDATAETTNDLDLNAEFGDNNADVSSLLPGLDSYANMPDDNPMPDLPTDVPQDQQLEANLELPDLTTLPDLTADGAGGDVGEAAGDMNFDFEFNLDDAGDTAGGGGGEGGGDGDNSFNDLFDVDDYSFDAPESKGGKELQDWMDSF